MRRVIFPFVSLMLIILLAACGNSDASGKANGKNEVTIGYFPNLTHITTIVGLEKGYFKEAYGDTKINTKTFTQGGLFMEALATNAIDIGTTGPGPVLNYFAKDSQYRIISGAVNGGATLIVDKAAKINRLEDLDGKKVAIPGIGNTQDIMLRKALKAVKLKAKTNGGTVDFYPSAPADSATLFRQHSVEAAAIPEPWGYVLEKKQGGKVLLDWQDFAWGKATPVTVVATSKDFLANKEKTEAFLTAHEKALQFIKAQPEAAKKLVIQHIKALTGKTLDKAEVDAAFDKMIVTNQVDEKVIQEMADISKEANYIPNSKIKGMIDTGLLNSIK